MLGKSQDIPPIKNGDDWGMVSGIALPTDNLPEPPRVPMLLSPAAFRRQNPRIEPLSSPTGCVRPTIRGYQPRLSISSGRWIGSSENLQETINVPMKYMLLSCKLM